MRVYRGIREGLRNLLGDKWQGNQCSDTHQSSSRWPSCNCLEKKNRSFTICVQCYIESPHEMKFFSVDLYRKILFSGQFQLGSDREVLSNAVNMIDHVNFLCQIWHSSGKQLFPKFRKTPRRKLFLFSISYPTANFSPSTVNLVFYIFLKIWHLSVFQIWPNLYTVSTLNSTDLFNLFVYQLLFWI